jgi:hypothetical protein
MKPSKRLRVLSGICFVLAVIAAIIWSHNRPDAKPPPSAPGYYYGPMKSKGDPNVYGTEAGQRVAPPPGALVKPASKPAGPGRLLTGG